MNGLGPDMAMVHNCQTRHDAERTKYVLKKYNNAMTDAQKELIE